MTLDVAFHILRTECDHRLIIQRLRRGHRFRLGLAVFTGGRIGGIHSGPPKSSAPCRVQPLCRPCGLPSPLDLHESKFPAPCRISKATRSSDKFAAPPCLRPPRWYSVCRSTQRNPACISLASHLQIKFNLALVIPFHARFQAFHYRATCFVVTHFAASY